VVTGLEFWVPFDSVGSPNWGVWSAADTALSSVLCESVCTGITFSNSHCIFLIWGSVLHSGLVLSFGSSHNCNSSLQRIYNCLLSSWNHCKLLIKLFLTLQKVIQLHGTLKISLHFFEKYFAKTCRLVDGKWILQDVEKSLIDECTNPLDS